MRGDLSGIQTIRGDLATPITIRGELGLPFGVTRAVLVDSDGYILTDSDGNEIESYEIRRQA